MKKHLFFLTTIIFLAISCTGQKGDSEVITDAYNNYQIAVSSKNIDEMVSYISEETIAYYNNIVEKAKFSDSVNLSMQPPIDKTLILYLRQTMSSSSLEKYSGKELMYFTLSKGLNVKNRLPITELKKINLNGNEATAEFLVDGVDSGNQIKFKKEGKNWKIDISSTYNLTANNQFRQNLYQSGLSENVFIKYMVTNMSGSEMNDSIWHKTIK
ncbi:hypothetical protein [Fluviicola taffensis]|uniref:hypothetical protein n=1 Tax=Fluviicola taffensis TaxID=191579 RepID=UPI003137C9B7